MPPSGKMKERCVKGTKDEVRQCGGAQGRKVLCVHASGNNQIGFKILGE